MDARRRDYLIRTAQLYYRDGLSQAGVARALGISRPTVSNLLKECRETGIVEIRIQSPSSSCHQLAQELEEGFRPFGLEKAFVVPRGVDDEESVREAARVGSAFLNPRLAALPKIAISWGTSLYHLVQQLTAPSGGGFEVAQLHGGLGSRNPEVDGFELARHLARRLGAEYHLVQAPALVNSLPLRDMLMEEPSIRRSVELCERADVALLGISPDDPQGSALVRSGFITEKQSQELLERGSVGHICCYHYDAGGDTEPFDINQRVIGVSAERLKAIPLRVAIACGARKAEAIAGALRGGFLSVLVTDEPAAQKILQHTGA
jgi:deoxyribonucleoside regulator